jgi:hypothetical protein
VGSELPICSSCQSSPDTGALNKENNPDLGKQEVQVTQQNPKRGVARGGEDPGQARAAASADIYSTKVHTAPRHTTPSTKSLQNQSSDSPGRVWGPALVLRIGGRVGELGCVCQGSSLVENITARPRIIFPASHCFGNFLSPIAHPARLQHPLVCVS